MSAKQAPYVPLILVVDDEPTTVQLIEFVLQRQGYRTKAAIDGPGALEAVKKFSPDLIVLDVLMPGMSGLDVCHRLKSDAQTSHIPVVILSALGGETEVQAGLSAGADAYLLKPFQPVELMKYVEDILKGRVAPSAPGTAGGEKE